MWTAERILFIVLPSCFWVPLSHILPSPRSRKLIQESEQHLKDVEKILQNDKRYLVLECVPEERRKLIMFYIEDLDRRGPPPPPTASEPTRRSTKWPNTSSSRPVPFSSLPSENDYNFKHDHHRCFQSLCLIKPAKIDVRLSYAEIYARSLRSM